MTSPDIFAVGGTALFVLGLYGLLVRRHLLRRIMALNVAGSGVFLLLGALAARGDDPDPVPQALIITGIVVAVSTTALALSVLLRLFAATGSVDLDTDDDGDPVP